MSHGNIRNLKSDIISLNSVLSKVKIKHQDPPLELKAQSNPSILDLMRENPRVLAINPSDVRQPIRKILSEQRARKSLANPSSKHDIDFVKKRFNIPSAATINSRQLGKARYTKPKAVTRYKPTILPRQFRDNPQAEPPPITEVDVNSGILSLIHRGLIPKDVDVTPAFERGLPPLQMKVAQFHDWRDMAPPPPSIVMGSTSMGFDKLALPATSPMPGEMDLDIRALVPVKTEIKTYEQIVDSFSTHQIMFRKGKIVVTPEFQSYKRVNSEQWGVISQALAYAEEVFSKLAMPLVYLNGKKLVYLIKDELRPLKFDDLLSCIMNSTSVLPMIADPAHKFKCLLGEDLAAVKIQAAWKRFKSFSAYQQLKVLIHKSLVIQSCLRNWKRKTQTRNLIKVRETVIVKKHQQIQKAFEEKYSNFKEKPRVEIHIFSVDEDIPSVITPEVLQSSQISRIFSVKNPLVTVILITPKILSEEIKNYYYRILEIGGISNPKDRVIFIHPDILNKHNLCLRTSSLLYFSSKSIHQLKFIIGYRNAYIVPGRLSLFDVKISVLLEIPIFSGDYTEIHKLQSKSEVKFLFQRCDFPIPYTEASITSEKMLYQKLALLIFQYSEVETWLFKCNREEGSRGIAYFETSSLKIISELRKSYDLRQACEMQDLINELKCSLCSVTKYVIPTLHKDWAHYMSRFTKYGGVIQAAPVTNKAYITFPAISFLIEPDGQNYYVNSGDCLHSFDYMNAAALSPQLSLSQEDIIGILNTLAKALYSKKIYGHMTLQLVAFVDPYSESMKPVPWAVDLSLGMTRLASSYIYFHFLMGGNMDPTTGKYFMKCVEEEEEERQETKQGEGNIYHMKDQFRILLKETELFSKLPATYTGENLIFHDFNLYDVREYLLCWEMWHPDLVILDLKTFFHLCRYEGISYDLEHGKGITFLIYDLLRYGYLGSMCISSTRDDLLKMTSQMFSFLVQHAGPAPPVELEYTGKEYRPLSELIIKIRIIEKKNFKAKNRRRVDEALRD